VFKARGLLSAGAKLPLLRLQLLDETKLGVPVCNVKAEAELPFVPQDKPHSKLAEDVFDFVKERGIAVGGLVVDFQRGVKLLYNLALLASQLRRRQHTHMIIKIAAPSAMRIGQALALNTKHRSALRTSGIFSRSSPVRPGTWRSVPSEACEMLRGIVQ